jgi:hypothetical protein
MMIHAKPLGALQLPCQLLKTAFAVGEHRHLVPSCYPEAHSIIVIDRELLGTAGRHGTRQASHTGSSLISATVRSVP